MRYDTSDFPGVKAYRLGEQRMRVENDSQRAFQVEAGPGRVVVISPGGVKEFDLDGETFSMGWHYPDEVLRAAGEPRLDPEHAWPFPEKPFEPADPEKDAAAESQNLGEVESAGEEGYRVGEEHP
jgi:hypothetical protein